ncbi:MAG: pyridoxamine 5'-phosphate oxidase family protein [Ferruginibacter sp.]|nr:pyridoxamine 5'-phosphate oxidase family protein [Ferruginibacter sp.]
MDTVLIDGINYNLEGLQKDCWNRLLNGSLRYKDAFHTVAVGNLNQHGINLRTVVLRKVWAAKKQLAFYSDTRSGKWVDLQHQNKVSFLFYDAPANLQIRLSGTATLHQTDAVADEAWADTRMGSRKVYLATPGPSTIIPIPASGIPVALETMDSTPEESIEGRKNFGVVVTNVNWMEWLWLNSKGHRRAVFKNSADGTISQDWLIP